uniref:SRCR domain-containing protein n=1 Tax=Parastrongyloides trichosuri TaxID=131310 RepID=A0A0N5A120_PARTI
PARDDVAASGRRVDPSAGFEPDAARVEALRSGTRWSVVDRTGRKPRRQCGGAWRAVGAQGLAASGAAVAGGAVAGAAGSRAARWHRHGADGHWRARSGQGAAKLCVRTGGDRPDQYAGAAACTGDGPRDVFCRLPGRAGAGAARQGVCAARGRQPCVDQCTAGAVRHGRGDAQSDRAAGAACAGERSGR